jgi:hypothetical protein
MKTDPQKANYWKQHIDAITSSNISRRAYCEQNGLKISTLDYWCQKLIRAEKESRIKETGWIPLQISEDSSSGIDLRIGRITISVKPGFNPVLLTEVLRTIGTLC